MANPLHRAAWISHCAPGAGSALIALPTDPEFCLDKDQFNLYMRIRLFSSDDPAHFPKPTDYTN